MMRVMMDREEQQDRENVGRTGLAKWSGGVANHQIYASRVTRQRGVSAQFVRSEQDGCVRSGLPFIACISPTGKAQPTQGMGGHEPCGRGRDIVLAPIQRAFVLR